MQAKLKKREPIMLLQDLDRYNCLCNGTRLIVTALADMAI